MIFVNCKVRFIVNVWCFLIVVLGLATVGRAWAEPSQPYANNPIVAIVDGQPVSLDELKNAKIQEAQVQLFQMQNQILKRKVLQMLAKKHPELREESMPKVLADDVSLFYKNTPGVKELGTLQEMEEEVRRYLESMYEATYIDRLFQRAIDSGWAVNYLKMPNDFRLVAGLGTAMLWFKHADNAERKVLVLEYSDFQCPFCKQVQKTLSKLRSRYAQSVQFAYRHFPLPFHKEAVGLAEAVECARDQGKFWELQTIIYRNSPDHVGNDDVLKYAESVGIKNMRDFKACMSQGKNKQRVLTDMKEGSQLGIQGTPTFVVGEFNPKNGTVNGEMFSGAVTEDKFIQTIEKYLSMPHMESKN